MIRALVSFVLTLGLIGAAALWAVNRVGDGRLMRAASPPISRTIELVAEELETGLSPTPVARESAPSAPEVEASEPASPGKAIWRVLGEVAEVDDEKAESSAAADDVSLAETPLDPSIEAGDHPEAPTDGADESLPQRVAGNNEALAESALLVRRMLGLYEQAVEAR